MLPSGCASSLSVRLYLSNTFSGLLLTLDQTGALQSMQYNLILHAKLNDPSHQKETLKLRLERLHGSKSSSLKMEKSTKEEIIEVLEGAVLHMGLAANTALDTATAKLEKVDEAYHESINSLVRQFKGLLTEVSRTQDDYASLKEVTNLLKVFANQKRLERLLHEAVRLDEMVRNLRPTPITQMQVSDHFTKIRQSMSDISLVTFDGLLLLQRRMSSCSVAEKRNEPTSSNDVGTGHQVVVDGLPPLVRQNDIRSLFGQFGKITNVTVDESKHGAVVTFSTATALQGAVAATPPHLLDATLRVSMPVNRKCRSETLGLATHA